MQHSIMECCISLIHLFYQGGHYEHDTTYPQQTASTRFQRVLPYQTAQLPELHSHPDRSEHRSPYQRHPSSHLGRCLLHRTQPLLHPSPDHGEKNGKRNAGKHRFSLRKTYGSEKGNVKNEVKFSP